MPIPSLTAALLLLFHSSAPVFAPPATTPWDTSGAPRFEVTADTAGEIREVPISPNRALSFVFDTPVQSEGAVVEEHERFRQVSLSEDGRLLTLLPSDELEPGKRLRLTVRFSDGATPRSADFTLVVSARAESQVEVYRTLRPCDSYRQQAEDAEVRAWQCQTLLERERAEREAPRGLTGLLALDQMNDAGVLSKRISMDIKLRSGESFAVDRAVSYRAPGGEQGAEVTRLAVDLRLWNRGSQSWAPTHAQLVGEGVRWDLEVWLPRPMAPGKLGRVVMEVERPGPVAPGPYLLKLWDESGSRAATLSGVTFP